MEFHECYALDYVSAREKFRAAAQASGAALSAYALTRHQGPGGVALYTDVARFGRAGAPRRLLVVSGTHGLEGYTGSAAQIAWIASGAASRLTDDTAVVMVHAINPWGFAHHSRTTENNVDLNRNFVDHAAPHPANPAYAELHGPLLDDDWSTASLDRAQQAMDGYAQRHGADALFDALARGQYTHPSGLNYGGTHREWSNLTMEAIAREHLAGAERIGFIDWHTGVGEYGQPFFLCFSEEGSELQDQAVRWWGRDAIVGQRPHGRARPGYHGLLFYGVQAFVPGIPVCGAVVEFGTRGWHMRRILRLDLWLKFKAGPASPRNTMLRADLLDAFCPVDQVWRDSTIAHALRITTQAVDGLHSW
ncbi:MAG: M14 family metallopeptidase [Proteobacteria bacterium]|nr:M14 family metallopeptidase [Pseudomonadota bacterium]